MSHGAAAIHAAALSSREATGNWLGSHDHSVALGGGTSVQALLPHIGKVCEWLLRRLASTLAIMLFTPSMALAASLSCRAPKSRERASSSTSCASRRKR